MEKEFEHRMTEVEERAKSNSKRLDKVEQHQSEFVDLVISVKTLAEREQNVENDVKEIKSDVKSLASKPGKKWDNLIDKITVALIGAIIGLLLSQLGLQ